MVRYFLFFLRVLRPYTRFDLKIAGWLFSAFRKLPIHIFDFVIFFFTLKRRSTRIKSVRPYTAFDMIKSWRFIGFNNLLLIPTIITVLCFCEVAICGSCLEAKLCCPGRDSSCVVQKTPINAIVEDPNEKPCYCDHACLKLGDCCADFKKACNGELVVRLFIHTYLFTYPLVA